jgi:hypothetical protein
VLRRKWDREFEADLLRQWVRISSGQQDCARKVPRFRGALRKGGDVRKDAPAADPARHGWGDHQTSLLRSDSVATARAPRIKAPFAGAESSDVKETAG